MIAFQLVLRHPKDRVCWISPSEYIYHTQKRSLAEAMPDFSPDMLSNLVFMTYAKLRVWDRQLEDLKPDWIILDEFHRAGSREWGKSVRKLLSLYPLQTAQVFRRLVSSDAICPSNNSIAISR